MNKSCLLTIAGIGAVLILLVFGALLALGYTFGILTTAPMIPHDDLVDASTRMQVAVDPGLAVQFLKSIDPNHELIRQRGLDMVLPYEVAMFAGRDQTTNELRLTGYINERRAGQVISMFLPREILNQLGQQKIEWDTEGLELRKRGMLVAEGRIPIPTPIEEWTFSVWESAGNYAPLKIEGGHLMEAALDNRDGGGYEIIATLSAMADNPVHELYLEGEFGPVMKTAVSDMRTLHAFLDPQGNSSLTLTFDLEFREGGRGTYEGMVTMGEPAVTAQLRDQLETNYGAGLEGALSWEGDTLHGVYTITEVGEFVKQQLAAQGYPSAQN